MALESEQMSIAAYFVPVVSIGLIGNVWVVIQLILLINRSVNSVGVVFKRLLVYILTLSIADILVLSMASVLVYYLISGSWPFGYFACKLFFVIENVNKVWSVGILAVISFERFMVVKRLSHLKIDGHSNCSVVVRLTLLLIFVFLLCLPIILQAETNTVLLISENGTVEEEWVECHSGLSESAMFWFASYMFVIGYVLPVALISICYMFLVCNLRKFLAFGSADVYTNRVVRSIVYVMVFHLVCWTPFWASVFLPVLANIGWINQTLVDDPNIRTLQMAASFLPYMNSAGNWIFYAALNRELRGAKLHQISAGAELAQFQISTPAAGKKFNEKTDDNDDEEYCCMMNNSVGTSKTFVKEFFQSTSS